MEKETKRIMVPETTWENLPSELLNQIYQKLSPGLCHIVRFRSVCKNWRSAAPLHNPPRQLPFLLELQEPHGRKSCLRKELRCYSLIGDKTYTITIPERFHGMAYYGPGHGYLLTSLRNNLHLLNPFTGKNTSLPKLKEGLLIKSHVCSGLDPVHNWYILSRSTLSKDWASWIPAIYNEEKFSWGYVRTDCHAPCFSTCSWEGVLFATEQGYPTFLYDAVSGQELNTISSPEVNDNAENSTYLIQSCGQILRVSKHVNLDFEIHKLCSEEGEEKGEGEGEGGAAIKKQFWAEDNKYW
jgi:F-box domain